MTPMYFPFTFIADPVVEMVHACFARMAVYQPTGNPVPESMNQWVGNGVLEIRVPVTGDEETIDRLCKAYVAWIHSHQGGEISHFRMQGDRAHFFDDTFVSQLKSDIQKKAASALTTGPEPDPLFLSRLFLHVAQDHDMKNWEIHRDLIAVGEMERALIGHLKGEKGDPRDPDMHETAGRLYELDNDRIPDRLQAWSSLFMCDAGQQGQDLPDIFLTTSRSALDPLVDKLPGFEEVLRMDSIPVTAEPFAEIKEWQAHLAEAIHALATRQRTGSLPETLFAPDLKDVRRRVSLTIFLAPQSPRDVFSTAGPSGNTDVSNEREGQIKHTVFALIEPQ